MLEQVFSGVSIGALYVLLSLGFTTVLGIGNMVNLAHGSVVLAGMYTVLELNTSWGVPVYLAVALATVIGAIAALAIYGLAVVPSRRAVGDGHREQLVYTLVIMSMLTAVFQLFFGGELRGLSFERDTSFQFVGVNLERARLVALVVAVVVTGAFYAWLQYSTRGKLLRMTGKFPGSSYAIGVPVQRIFLVLFCLGGAMAGLAGGLLITVLPVSPTLGFEFLVIALIVSIAGRLTFLGVGIVGLAYGTAQVLLNNTTSGSSASAILFMAFLAVLSLERVFVARSGRRTA
jgi:branched-chain amino acid transport system permease protein